MLEAGEEITAASVRLKRITHIITFYSQASKTVNYDFVFSHRFTS